MAVKQQNVGSKLKSMQVFEEKIYKDLQNFE